MGGSGDRQRPSLGATRFEAEFEAGKRLGRDAALGLALGQPAHAAAAASGDAGAGLLAKREADVARLVADGLTNKQIGARLFISERTVDSHVRSILNKLGFNSRAQIAAWMASSNQ
jgi:DNA-binding NarL/FixJ family response regulator